VGAPPWDGVIDPSTLGGGAALFRPLSTLRFIRPDREPLPPTLPLEREDRPMRFPRTGRDGPGVRSAV